MSKRETKAPILDIPAIRRAAQEGLPVLPGAIIGLCDRIGALQERHSRLQSDYDAAWLSVALQTLVLYDVQRYLRGGRCDVSVLQQHITVALESVATNPFSPLLTAARAWADARKKGGVVAAEEALLAAIRGCGG